MECLECKQSLIVANSKFESEQGSTEVYNVHTMVCVNPKCPNYAGTNLNKPLKVAKIIKNKVG